MSIVVVVAAAVLAQAPSTSAARDLSAFAALPADPAPAEITRGQHYWVGNEDRLDLFADDLLALRGKGGVHVGVGAEQNWVFAGWSRPDVLVLMDFDQAIVDLHRVYFVAFTLADTRERFLALWNDRSRKELRDGILAQVPKGAARAGALEALRIARWSVERRFARLSSHLSARGFPTFLDDDEQYRFLRDLVRDGRAFAVRGDLTAKKTMQAIGAACRQSGLFVQSLYLSNAEQYFMYQKQTRANFASLPYADDSVVLRTHGWGVLGYADSTPPKTARAIAEKYQTQGKPKDDYHYGVQSGPSFAAFSQSPLVWSSRQILQWSPRDGEKGSSKLMSVDVAAVKAAFDERTRAMKRRPAQAEDRAPTQTGAPVRGE